ncbi:MAG TPA: hypothetical protein VGR73_03090 [Bryobacteraceae bacterium]|nr:hypothetical protein [Bryobacteraceae bacterium]
MQGFTRSVIIAATGWVATPILAQTPVVSGTCSQVAAWSSCDVTFELNAQENTPQATLRAEFRSPKLKTILIDAFHEGSKLVLRVTPTEAGTWDYRLTSSVARLEGQAGQIKAVESNAPGFVHAANVHHFATERSSSEDRKPHLWMGAPVEHFTTMPRAEFDRLIDQRVKDRFTHAQVTIEADTKLDEAAECIRAINAQGLVADLALASVPIDAMERQRYVSDIVARFAPFNIVWAGVASFENTPHSRAILKETGTLIQRLDPYAHPRMTLAASTAGPVAGDGWADLLGYGTPSADVGAVEHQLYQLPAVNAGIKTRADLWNATMNGQYPGAGDGPQMKVWFDFLSASRYWDLEPYFDVEGGRALALEGVEYLVYIEKPATVTLKVENHGYEVAWMNPANGEAIKEKKEYKGELFTGDPPDASHDWVLRVSREGRKEGMLRSYKFESRRVPVQEVETQPAKIPFEIAAPEGEEMSMSRPVKFALKLKRESKATRSLLVEWTLEQPGGSAGYRVVGTGGEGEFAFPRALLDKPEGVVSLKLNVLNALGKAYTLDKVYRLIP